MLRGRFGNTSGRPHIEGTVIIPRLSLGGNVSFIFDTGADDSFLMPIDAQRINVDYSQLKDPIRSSGIGGASASFTEYALVIFAALPIYTPTR